MANGGTTDWGTNVPIYGADGKLRAVPQDPGMIKAVLSEEGNQRAIPMLDRSTGKHHWVPEDQMHDMLGQGHVIDFPTHDIAKWYGFTPSNVLTNAWQNFKGFYTGLKDIGVDLATNPNWVAGTPQQPSTLEKFVERPMEQQVVKAGQALNEGRTVAGVGHALASGVPLIGPWAAGLGEQAGTGDIGGAAGVAGGTLAAVKAPAMVAAGANAVLPSRIRAQAGLDRVSMDAATRTPDYTKTTKFIDTEIQKASVTGRPDLPPQVLALYARGLAAGAGRQAPATFPELYDHLKAINEALYIDKSVPKSQVPATKTVAQSLANDLSAATKEMPRGYSRLWDQSLDEYHHAMQAGRAMQIIGPLVGGAIGFGVGRGFGRDIGAPLAGELAAGYAGRLAGKPLAGALVRSITGREMPPVPPEAPLPQGAAYRVGQAAGRVRNFMTGGPPVPPTAAAPPSAPPVPPMATAAPMPPPAPPATTPTARPLTPAELAIQQAPGGRGVAKDIGQWQPPPELGAFSAEDVGAKVKGKDVSRNAKVLTQAEALGGKPPEGTPERRLVDRSGQAAEDRLFAQARRELGEGATSEAVGKRVAELKAKTRPSAPPPPPKPIARNLPPEAYTRFLLQAKEGLISPGELERRFAKYGQPYEVRPLKRG